jgi:transcriptional regulator with XRE-family HTH domain
VGSVSPDHAQNEDPADGNLPHRLYQLRIQQGLTQRQMAAALGLSAHSNIADFEAGRRLPHNDILVSYEQHFALAGGELQRMRQHALAARARSRAPRAGLPFSPLDGAAPRELGGFQLVGRIGAGSYGSVYLALTAGGRPAAVKIAHPALADDREFRSRLEVEAAALGQLSTPRVAELIHAGTEASPPWVALGYVAGPSLGDVIAASGPLAAAQVGALAAALAGAIADLRAVGVTHVGLGPGRIRLAGHGPQLVGSVMRWAAAGTPYARTVLVDPAFLAPEQITGPGVDPATDIFVLGVLLAYAATGCHPFGSGGPPETVRDRILHEGPDQRLTGLIARCLSKDPRERPALEEIAAAVPVNHPAVPRVAGRFTETASLPTPAAGQPSRRNRRGLAAMVLTGAVCSVSTLAVVALALLPGARPAASVSSPGQHAGAIPAAHGRYDAYACVDSRGPPPGVRLDPSGNPRDAGWRSSTPWPWGTPFCPSQIWWAPYLNGGANLYARFSWIFRTSMSWPATCLVWAYYPLPPSGHSGGTAHYMVDDGTGTAARQVASIDVPQSRYKGSWHGLGQYRITSGTLTVTLDNSGTDPDPEQGPIAGPMHTSCYPAR